MNDTNRTNLIQRAVAALRKSLPGDVGEWDDDVVTFSILSVIHALVPDLSTDEDDDETINFIDNLSLDIYVAFTR